MTRPPDGGLPEPRRGEPRPPESSDDDVLHIQDLDGIEFLPTEEAPRWRGLTPRSFDEPADRDRLSPDSEGIRFLPKRKFFDPDEDTTRTVVGPSSNDKPMSEPEALRFLLSRSTDEEERSGRKGKDRLRFKIQHIMYLTAWTAMLLSVRGYLIDAAPTFVTAIVWASGLGGAAMIAGVYGIAWLMEEGVPKDRLVLRILYFLCADMVLLFIFTILDKFN